MHVKYVYIYHMYHINIYVLKLKGLYEKLSFPGRFTIKKKVGYATKQECSLNIHSFIQPTNQSINQST